MFFFIVIGSGFCFPPGRSGPANIAEKKGWGKFQMLKIIYFREIRKVKAVSPSPFYDGTYHPPLIGHFLHAVYIEI
jgi:hypothetical protein